MYIILYNIYDLTLLLHTLLQDKQPELQPLPNHPHQQPPFNYYPGYQTFYHQQHQSSTLPGHYIPPHQQPLPHQPYRHYTLPVISTTCHHSPYTHYHQQQEYQQYPQGYEHRSSSPAVLEHTAIPQTTQYNLHPPNGYPVHSFEHRSSSPAVLEHTAIPQTTQYNLHPPNGYGAHSYEHRPSSPTVLEYTTAHTAIPQTTPYNLQPPNGYVVTQSNMVSSQNPSPVMCPSPVPLPSQSPMPLLVPLSSPVPSVPSPVASHTPQNVEQSQLSSNSNLPTNPQQIDTQLQELMKQIEVLKLQREVYEKTSKQDEGMYNEQLY